MARLVSDPSASLAATSLTAVPPVEFGRTRSFSLALQPLAHLPRTLMALHGPPPIADHDDHWMSLALDQADIASAHRDVPIGAVVVRQDGLCLATGHNRREADSDPTAHAELLALRSASASRGHWRLHDAVLYVTLEPCAMCAGALVNSRISRVVFGAWDAKAGALGSLFDLSQDPRLNHRFPVRSEVRAEDCRQRLKAFFLQLRQAGEK